MVVKERNGRGAFWAIASGVAVILLAFTASAEAIVWSNGSGDATWDNALNWTPNANKPTSSDDIVFNSPLNPADGRVTLAAGEQGKSLTLNDSYTLTGGDLTLGGSVSVATGKTATIASSLAATMADLVKAGAGTLVLTGSNAHTGLTNVSAGVLNIQHNSALGSTAAGTTVANGAQLQLQNNVTVSGEPLTLNGGISLRSVAGANTWAGSINVVSLSTVTVDTGSSLNISGNISGIRFDKRGLGTLILSGDNSANTGYMDVNEGLVSLRSDKSPIGSYFHVNNAAPTVEIVGGVTTPAGKIMYLSGTATTNSPAFRGVGGDSVWGGTVVLHVGAGNRNIAVDAGSTLTINGAVSESQAGANGARNLVKLGEGTLFLKSGSSYTGRTEVKSGILKLGQASSLGYGEWMNATPAGTLIQPGAVVDLNGQATIQEIITLNGSGIGGTGALVNTGTTEAVLGDGVVHIPLAAGGSNYSPTVAVSISGNGTGAAATAVYGLTSDSFTLTSGGSGYTSAPSVTVNGGNNARATATVSGGQVTAITLTAPGWGFTGAPTFTFTGGGGSGVAVTGNNTHFTVVGVRVTAAGSGYTAPPTVSLSGGGGSGAAAGTPSLASVILASDSTIGGTGNIAIQGVISGAYGLTKTGNNVLTLSGANTYSGTTTVNGGTLRLAGGANRVNPASAVVLRNGATLDLNGQNQTINNLNNNSSHVTLGSGTLTLLYADVRDHTGTAGNLISGSGKVVKTSTADMYLAGPNSYTGGTDIQQGMLALYTVNSTDANNTLPTTGDVNLNAGAVLDLSLRANSNIVQTINRLTGSGTVRMGTWSAGPGTVNFIVGNGDGSSTFDGKIINGNGTIGLTKTGSGTITLAGANTYTGPTTVQAGTLLIDDSITSSVTVSGGWLGGDGRITGSVDVKAAGSISAGHSPGHLQIEGDYHQAGTLLAEIGGSTAGSGYDWIEVSGTSGTATFAPGAVINIDVGGSLDPGSLPVGGHFEILTATGGITNPDLSDVTLNFSGASLPLAGTMWKAAIVPWLTLGPNAEALQLSVAAPEPASLVLLVLGGLLSGVLARRRRKARA